MLDLVKVHLPNTITKSLDQVKENYDRQLKAAIEGERLDKIQRESEVIEMTKQLATLGKINLDACKDVETLESVIKEQRVKIDS